MIPGFHDSPGIGGLGWPPPAGMEAIPGFLGYAVEEGNARPRFLLPGLVDANSTVYGKRFEACDLHGPAMVVLANCDLGSFWINSPEKASVWALPEETERPYAGFMRMLECTMNRCRFFDVTFVGDEDFKKEFQNRLALGAEFREE